MTELNVIRKPFFILRDEFPAFQLFWKWIVLERLWVLTGHELYMDQ